MTLDRYEPAGVVVDSPQDAALRRLAEWARSAEAAHGVAVALASTAFVPEAFRGKPDDATAAILAGLEVGLQPMAALRSFDVIGGQAAPRALTLRAIVQAAGHDVVLEESTATACKMRGKRNGSTVWQTVRWTIDRARSLNLAGKPNWKSQPQAMLVARATSEICRLIAADAILGIAYTVEELADGDAGVSTPDTTSSSSTSSSTSGKRRMSRRRPAEPDPPVELAAGDDDELDDQDDGDDRKPTRRQTEKAMAMFTEQGFGDRAQRLAVTSTMIGRAVGSWSDVTRTEAGKVIDTLERLASGETELIVDNDEYRLEHVEQLELDDEPGDG